jgi:hypothetical protein
MPGAYDPHTNQGGSTRTSFGRFLVVTVLPSPAAAGKFKIAVFAGFDADVEAEAALVAPGQRGATQQPTFSVQRSEGRVAALHATLEHDLGPAHDAGSKGSSGESSSSSSRSRSGGSSGGSGSAASAAADAAAGLLMGGLSGLGMFGTPAPKEPIANPFLVTPCIKTNQNTQYFLVPLDNTTPMIFCPFDFALNP